jgi:hypothetical protein
MCHFTAASVKAIPFLTVGAVLIINCLLSKFELGCLKIISNTAHLIIDGMAGTFLVISPWILGFSEEFYLPHVATGIAVILLVVFTRTR